MGKLEWLRRAARIFELAVGLAACMTMLSLLLKILTEKIVYVYEDNLFILSTEIVAVIVGIVSIGEMLVEEVWRIVCGRREEED